jgi:hypothetical protein
MAASIVIEEERGTFTRSAHPHNGYYAGEFRGARPQESSFQAFELRVTITSQLR